jgi:two-component system sensor histidine kinase KdpD
VQNLLDMSRIQAGVLKPRTTIVSPADLAKGVIDDSRGVLREHPLRLEVPDDLPPVDVDVVLISRVIANLLENAARHGPKATPITLEARDVGRAVKFCVSDEGPGIARERRNEIFDLFARRDADAGAGLGLSIAKTFVEAHGQRIWVEDALGGGARLCFTVPVAESLSEE